MSNHPNRGGSNPARNPKPAEIKKLRIQAGLSQAGAGELLYTTVGSWQQWEGGLRRMHPAFWELFQIKVKQLGD